jgi:myosin heavy subunit
MYLTNNNLLDRNLTIEEIDSVFNVTQAIKKLIKKNESSKNLARSLKEIDRLNIQNNQINKELNKITYSNKIPNNFFDILTLKKNILTELYELFDLVDKKNLELIETELKKNTPNWDEIKKVIEKKYHAIHINIVELKKNQKLQTTEETKNKLRNEINKLNKAIKKYQTINKDLTEENNKLTEEKNKLTDENKKLKEKLGIADDLLNKYKNINNKLKDILHKN